MHILPHRHHVCPHFCIIVNPSLFCIVGSSEQPTTQLWLGRQSSRTVTDQMLPTTRCCGQEPSNHKFNSITVSLQQPAGQ